MLELLKMDVSELINADNMAAIITPRNPRNIKVKKETCNDQKSMD